MCVPCARCCETGGFSPPPTCDDGKGPRPPPPVSHSMRVLGSAKTGAEASGSGRRPREGRGMAPLTTARTRRDEVTQSSSARAPLRRWEGPAPPAPSAPRTSGAEGGELAATEAQPKRSIARRRMAASSTATASMAAKPCCGSVWTAKCDPGNNSEALTPRVERCVTGVALPRPPT